MGSIQPNGCNTKVIRDCRHSTVETASTSTRMSPPTPPGLRCPAGSSSGSVSTNPANEPVTSWTCSCRWPCGYRKEPRARSSTKPNARCPCADGTQAASSPAQLTSPSATQEVRYSPSDVVTRWLPGKATRGYPQNRPALMRIKSPDPHHHRGAAPSEPSHPRYHSTDRRRRSHDRPPHPQPCDLRDSL